MSPRKTLKEDDLLGQIVYRGSEKFRVVRVDRNTLSPRAYLAPVGRHTLDDTLVVRLGAIRQGLGKLYLG